MITLSKVQADVLSDTELDLSSKTPEQLKAIAYAGLAEEVGEVQGLRKRVLRNKPGDEKRCTHEHFVEELGDVLWYLAMVCNLEHVDMEDMWQYCRNKLKERYGHE